MYSNKEHGTLKKAKMYIDATWLLNQFMKWFFDKNDWIIEEHVLDTYAEKQLS